MSDSYQKRITCPKCKTPGTAVIHPSVNVTLLPKMKEQVLTREFFMYRCPICGSGTEITHSCLYHDMEKHYIIYLIPKVKPDEIIRLQEWHDQYNVSSGQDQLPYYILRIVQSVTELIEKISIFDRGKDDRTIEICKILIAEMILQDNVDFDYRDSFYYCDGAEEKITYFEPGKQGYTATLSEEFYADVQSYAKEYLDELYSNKYSKIDAEYADVVLYQIACDERESNKGAHAE